MNRRHFFKVLAGLFGSTLLAKFLPESFWSAWSVPPRGLENPIFSGEPAVIDGFAIFKHNLGLLTEMIVEEAQRPRCWHRWEEGGFIIVEPSPLSELK